jgi:transcriptional regulator with XRE-family HTH domain
MKAFGDRLRNAREAQAVSVHDVAAATRISERYLNALEHDELEALPGRVFAKGYIKSYAQFLDIDAQPLLDAYDEAERELGRGTPEDERRQLEELARVVSTRPATGNASRGILPATVGLALVALVFGASWFALRRPSPEPAAREAPARARSHPPSPEPSPQRREVALVPATSALRISQSGVGTGVVDRNLVGRNDRFPEGDKIWFWTRAVGGKKGDRIRHVWLRGERVYMDAELRIGAEHWRTYTTLVLEPGTAGEWAAEVRTIEGEVLAREEFLCVSSRDGT